MLPIDSYQKWSTRLDEDARLFLSPAEHQHYLALPAGQRLAQLRALLEKPIAHFSPVNEAFARARWAEVLQAACPDTDTLTLLEIASGDADMIPQMMARVRPRSRYITANMNRKLTRNLRAHTHGLPLEIVVIEEDAAGINRHLPAGSVDLIAFQHAVNDVIQAILCDQRGVDTIDTDWMDTLPEMIRILQEELAHHTLELHAKPAFLSLLSNLLVVLKPGGVIAMNHYMFQLDLDWGYPPALWENIIPITRQWVEGQPGCVEVSFAGFHPQWWLFLKKI